MIPSHKPSAVPGPRTIGSVMSRLLARTGYDREQGSDGLAAVWQQVAPAGIYFRQKRWRKRCWLRVSVSYW